MYVRMYVSVFICVYMFGIRKQNSPNVITLMQHLNTENKTSSTVLHALAGHKDSKKLLNKSSPRKMNSSWSHIVVFLCVLLTSASSVHHPHHLHDHEN